MDEELEIEPTQIRGEYIWDGSYLAGADIDVNDRGHEGHFEQEIISNIKDDLVDWAKETIEKLKSLPKEEMTEDQEYALESIPKDIKNLNMYDGEVDPEEFNDLLKKLKYFDSNGYQEFFTRNKEYLEGLKDARKWGVKQGNIISRGNNFELWGWNDALKKKLIDMLYEIENSEEEITPPTKINIYDYASGKNYDFTFEQLQGGESGATLVPGAAKTASNIHIPWNRSMLQGDSTIYKTFGNWVQLREGKDLNGNTIN